MGPSIVIILALFGFLTGQPIEPVTLEECCKDGRERGLQRQECSSLPLISESTTCRIAQEQCCVAALDDTACTNGINMAKDHGACETCCDCCLLGKAAQELGQGCEPSLSVGYQCGLVSRACCVDGSSEGEATPTATTDPLKDNLTTSEKDEPVITNQCKGASKCAHRCVGNGTCSCFKGHKLKADGKSCEDIDECETGTHNCVAEFECQNTVGSFRCRPRKKCGDGFIQDALGSCIDINECLTQTEPYIDECANTNGPCEGHTCVNLMGSFRCDCRTGFNFNSLSRSCEDINECRHFPGRLCVHKCENQPGSYQCSCMTGFTLASDNRNCNDLNECESNPCSQECANVYGSYQCYCRRGYQLSDIDGITCEDIDECALPTAGHICSYRCNNTPGSFQCTCPSPGYTLASNGRSCQDIDECVTGTHGCADSETCFNVQGGFRCLSFDCPPNYRHATETSQFSRADTVRCVKSCQPNDITCILDPIQSFSHTVRAVPGPKHIRLHLAMNYVVGGVVSHRNILYVHIFISEFWF
ncbi:hypothetical protein JZ751_006253 [Albula glossodonta]|uniref:Fibulin-1 n=1 Tax=Albula glossodonta TaxID=121402 RepID=A0A8T2N8F5_9TELE|nr:hypothetical protein JZ751_006253 [Albula glossodonta]